MQFLDVDNNKITFVLQNRGRYLSQATLESWQTSDFPLTEPDIVLLGGESYNYNTIEYFSQKGPTEIILSYSLKKKKDYTMQRGLNDNTPGIQNSLHVVEIFANYSMVWINPSFEKHLDFIFRNLFQIYHRLIIEMGSIRYICHICLGTNTHILLNLPENKDSTSNLLKPTESPSIKKGQNFLSIV